MMRRLLAGLILMGFAGTGVAQQPPPEALIPVGPPPTDAEVILAQVPARTTEAVGQQHSFGAQIQFGYPTGLRLQYTAVRTEHASFLVEGFAGARSAFWGDEAVYGIGGRALFTLSANARNALMFGPGIGFSYWRAPNEEYSSWYHQQLETNRTFLIFDANIGWLHELTPSLGWEIGLNVGARVGLTGQSDGGEKVSGKVSGGTIGVYTGFRF
jgi:hypothetical protein